MRSINRLIKRLPLLALMPLILSACGGGGGSTDGQAAVMPVPQPIARTTLVEGIAAAGAPLSGTVYLSDASFPAREVTAPINQDGTYAIDVTGLQAPFILKAADASGNTWYSFAKAPGIVNINPLTNLVVAVAAGATDMQSLAELYATHNMATLQRIAGTVTSAAADITASLQPLLAMYGAATADPLNGPYAVNQQGLDAFFDQVAIGVSGGTATITRIDTRATVFSAPISNITSGTVDTGGMPTPPQSYMPGNAVLTLNLQGSLPQGALVDNLSLSVQLPLGVTVDTGPAGMNTAVPIGTASGANVYPVPALSATNNVLTVSMSSLAGFGTGNFLTIRCIVSSASLMAAISATDFKVTTSSMYADIYKNQRLTGLTVVPVSLVYPAADGEKLYVSLCAGCHTLDPSGSVVTPSLYGTASQLPTTFATSHHGVTLAATQVDDLLAYLNAYYLGQQILVPAN